METDPEVTALVEELYRLFPEKGEVIGRYVAGERFRRLPTASQIEGLAILRAALGDERRKGRPS